MEIRSPYQLLPDPAWSAQQAPARGRNAPVESAEQVEQQRRETDRNRAGFGPEYREQARETHRRRAETERFREVYAMTASPQGRRAVDAYTAHRPSDIPDNLVGFDDYA